MYTVDLSKAISCVLIRGEGEGVAGDLKHFGVLKKLTRQPCLVFPPGKRDISLAAGPESLEDYF